MLAVSRSGGTPEVVMRGQMKDFHFRIPLGSKAAHNFATSFPLEPQLIG
jgi:hypothetical protein